MLKDDHVAERLDGRNSYCRAGDHHDHVRERSPESFHPAAPAVLPAVTIGPPQILAQVVAVEHHRIDAGRAESLEPSSAARSGAEQAPLRLQAGRTASRY